MAEPPLQKFQSLLRELFQFEHGDLNFGIYRIMNLRRTQMERWINEELPKRAEAALRTPAISVESELASRLADLRQKLVAVQADAIDPDGRLVKLQDSDLGKEYQRIWDQQRSAPAKTPEEIESDLYNYLYAFFSRYYDRGDFISQRRYSFARDGRDTYAVPYSGEEVILHWANKDQYYIKTGERFSRYEWQAPAQPPINVRFELTEATVERENQKAEKERFYVPAPDAVAWDEQTRTLTLPFQFRSLTEGESAALSAKQNAARQDELLARAQETVLKSKVVTAVSGLTTALLAPKKDSQGREMLNKNDKPIPLIEHHLRRRVAENTADYFIHKDLGRFLSGELDYYIKSDVLGLDAMFAAGTLRAPAHFQLVQAVRDLGHDVIDFLAQFENFQKALFDKRKFVTECRWCITLDWIEKAALLGELVELLNNNDGGRKQIGEWKSLFAIHQVPGFAEPITAEFLRSQKFLVLDTAFMPDEFADRLLATISDLDASSNGLLLHSDNFHALNLLAERYRERVQCVHIDPPYNTQTSGFLYKNSYQHSSWLAMIAGVTERAASYLTADGSFLCHVDENEYERLHLLFDTLSIPSGGTIVWDKKNPMLGRKGVATQHEYIAWRTKTGEPIYLRNEMLLEILSKAEEIQRKHGGVTDAARREFSDWISKHPGLTGGERAYQLLNDDGRVYQSVYMGAPEPRTDPKFHIPLIHPQTNKPCPVPPNGWSRAPETIKNLLAKDEIIFGEDETTQPRRKVFLTPKSQRQLSSVIQDSNRGKVDLDKLGLEFPYGHPVSLYVHLVGAAAPDSDALICDFFAGSGTNAHAVLTLNRADRTERKYLLTEAGEQFDTVLKPRIQKVVYSDEWNAGKPVSRRGSSQIFKYLRLESYEDALDNIEFRDPGAAQPELSLASEYALRYALDWESRQSPTRLLVEALNAPFDYTLELLRNEKPVTIRPDLPETFNYLIGLIVSTRRAFFREDEGKQHRYLIYTGTLRRNGEKAAIIWRTCRGWNESEFQKEKKWWNAERGNLVGDATLLYVNATCTFGARSLDPEFKKRMHAPVAST